MRHKRVMIVDDCEWIRKILRIYFEQLDWEVVCEASTGEVCLAMSKTVRTDLILLDLVLPKDDGIATLKQLAKLDRRPMIVVTSGLDQPEIRERVQVLGASGFLAKPFTQADVGKMITSLGL